MRKSPRDRRLIADHESVQQLQAESTIFSFQASGNPPQRYRLIFKGAGIKRDPAERVVISRQHEVIVELGAAYPRMIPNLAWQTPIFHPNISNNGVVCLGGYGTHWVPSLTLSEMCTMLWEMIRYQNFDSDSPYNREAALWSKFQNELKFPLDNRSIRDRVSDRTKQIVDAEVVITEGFELAHRKTVVSHPQISKETDVIETEVIETGIEIIEHNDRQQHDATEIFYIE